MSKTYQSAEIVQTAEGKQYHIGLKPGEIAPYILLSGDPARAHLIASFFDEARAPITNREYVTITGKYAGIPISVMATGMGTDNTEMALVEISQIVESPTFLRIGTSGGISPKLNMGDLVISSGGVRLENTSDAYAIKAYPAVANYEVVLALLEASKRHNVSPHLGVTATASGFYGSQGRTTPKFKPLNPNLSADLKNMGVLNLEMETSCLFVLSQIAGFRAGALCTAINSRSENEFIDEKALNASVENSIKVGLEAIKILNVIDEKKGNNPYWLPSMGL